MNTYNFTIYGNPIAITVGDGGGNIESKFQREVCPCCQQPDCNRDCNESQGEWKKLESDEDVVGRLQYNAVLDALESVMLAHACGGIDVSDPRYVEGIETTLEAAGNNL